MEPQDFAVSVRAHRPPDLPQFALDAAIKHQLDFNQTTRGDIPKCILLARTIADVAVEHTTDQRSGDEEFVRCLAPDRLITSEYILDLIRSDLEAARRKIFGSPEPPFTDYERAVAWLEGKAQKKKADKKGKRALDRVYREWVDKAWQLQKLTTLSVVPKLERKTITYLKPGEKWTQVVPVDRGSPLAILEDFIRKAALRTGFSQPALVLHVLTPIRPVLPRWRWSYKPPIPNFSSVGRFTVEILAQNVTWKDMQLIYRTINRELGRSKATLLDETDQVMLGIVKGLGGEPHKGKMLFWQSVYEECKRQGVTTLGSMHAARIRHKRLMRKIAAFSTFRSLRKSWGLTRSGSK